ncbi:DUF305 domain-containing protein [Neolewinella antarctica]|uniref:DUF305 domain-containing protein n=1 Tax=Neolewinella antarctica TaxID=442734 RepID=A0ABX0XAM2_9BACT|nr:DUF305 domain-containing protein [Neolewinella antarctica]NJC25847.1 hypothetical protein [Neolewinella antarctica]
MEHQNGMNPYLKFALMMGTSFLLMYAIMYLNVDRFEHIYLADTRNYMTTLMISAMAIVMLLFMWGMYPKKGMNYAIIGGAGLLFVLCLVGVRNQTFVGDVQWMKGMIPHHSIAIMVSKHADLKDPEVIKLAEDIIEAQEREIAQMKAMLDRLENEK